MRFTPRPRRQWRGLPFPVALLAITVLEGTTPAHAQSTVRVTIGVTLGQGIADGPSDSPSVSADGRFVAFASRAGNLLPGGEVGREHVYVRDRLTGSTVHASVASNGAPADNDCLLPAISADGRFVAFLSRAGNLAPGVPGGRNNIFVRDLAAHTTVCASLAADGGASDGNSFLPSLSANGRYVAFESTATNLVASDTNGEEDVFVRDLASNTTTRVSVAADGSESNTHAYSATISGDGRFVAFAAGDGNLVAGDTNDHDDVFVRDTLAKTTERASMGIGGAQPDGECFNPVISADGRRVAFDSKASDLVPEDHNNAIDVFVRDLADGTTVRASVATGGGEVSLGGNTPSLSADGQRVAFASGDETLVPNDDNGAPDIFVRDLAAGTTTRVSVATGNTQADASSFGGVLSTDGRLVAFSSVAANLTQNDANGATDVFARDLSADSTSLVSVASELRATPSNRDTAWASVSQDGRYVAFYSAASNLVPDDTNGIEDVFVRDTWANTTERVSVSTGGAQATGAPAASFGAPGISADGRYVAFYSGATNLVPGDTNGAPDVFVRDRSAGTTTRVSVSSGGEQAGSDANLIVWNSVAISATGRYVAFVSSASNLVPGDTNQAEDLFLRDTVAGTTERVNLTPAGEEAARGVQATFPSISADGRYVAFDSSYDLTIPQSEQTSQIRSFIRDRVKGTTLRLPGNSLDGTSAQMNASGACISADGKTAAFTTYIVPVPSGAQAARGVYVQDLETKEVKLISHTHDASYPNEGSWYPAISGDGGDVAFYSYASNLLPGDANANADIFRWHRATDTLAMVSLSAGGGQANSYSSDAGISGDGRFVVFATLASNLVPGDTNNANDIFMRGPLPGGDPPYAVLDLRGALGIAGGLITADATAMRRLNLSLAEVGPNAIDLRDAVLIARKVAGLEPNP